MEPGKPVRKKNNVQKGKEGEERAAQFMEAKGYSILLKNYRSGRAEIDLILRKGDLLVFAEVKMRKNNLYGEPEESVNARKAELIIEAAENFIFDNDWKGAIRFDIISIAGKKEILHMEDAFS